MKYFPSSNILLSSSGGCDDNLGALLFIFIALFIFLIIFLIRNTLKMDTTDEENSEFEKEEAKYTIPSSTGTTSSQVKEKSCLGSFIKVFVVLLLVIAVGFNLIQRCSADNDAEPKLWERVATKDDFSIGLDYNFITPTDIVILVVPKKDIDDLTLEIRCSNGGTIIFTEFLYFGDVDKNRTYQERVSIINLVGVPFKENTRVTYSVYDGTVSLF